MAYFDHWTSVWIVKVKWIILGARDQFIHHKLLHRDYDGGFLLETSGINGSINSIRSAWSKPKAILGV